jgi:hypothetical protein
LAARGQCTPEYQVHVPSSRRTTLPTVGAGGSSEGAVVATVASSVAVAGADALDTDGAGAAPTSTVGAVAGAVLLLSHPAAKVITNDAASARFRDLGDLTGTPRWAGTCT